jgi:hypothetical protein
MTMSKNSALKSSKMRSHEEAPLDCIRTTESIRSFDTQRVAIGKIARVRRKANDEITSSLPVPHNVLKIAGTYFNGRNRSTARCRNCCRRSLHFLSTLMLKTCQQSFDDFAMADWLISRSGQSSHFSTILTPSRKRVHLAFKLPDRLILTLESTASDAHHGRTNWFWVGRSANPEHEPFGSLAIELAGNASDRRTSILP